MEVLNLECLNTYFYNFISFYLRTVNGELEPLERGKSAQEEILKQTYLLLPVQYCSRQTIRERVQRVMQGNKIVGDYHLLVVLPEVLIKLLCVRMKFFYSKLNLSF